MRSFWDLVGFEYKKIFKKKSAIITLILAFAITIFSCFSTLIGYYYVDSENAENKYNAMIKDREYQRALSGRPIDSKLLLETSKAYAKVPIRDKYNITKEYELYARPYSAIHNIMTNIYNSELHRFELKDVQNLTQAQANSFYSIRYSKLKASLNSKALNNNSKTKLLELDKNVKKPFIFEYCEGYQRFFAVMYTTGIFTCFAAAICLASIFSGEYTSRTDQLILSSKYGKGKLIFAKLFTGISLSGILCAVMTFITYLLCMLIYGFDGANGLFQLHIPMCSYPLTMGQVALIFSICILFANLFSTAITLLLSAKLKSPFKVIIIISAITIIPMCIGTPITNVLLHNIINLIPANMMGLWTITSPILYEFFGMSVQPYIFMPIFAGIATIVLLPFAYRGFKNHQVV